jgi:hypothetical protein
MRDTKHRGSPTFVEPPLAVPMPVQGLRPRNGSGLTFTFILFRLFAVAATLLLALVAASAGTSSRLVALGEDDLTSQEISLVSSGKAARKGLAVLDDTSGSSEFRASDGRQRH